MNFQQSLCNQTQKYPNIKLNIATTLGKTKHKVLSIQIHFILLRELSSTVSPLRRCWMRLQSPKELNAVLVAYRVPHKGKFWKFIFRFTSERVIVFERGDKREFWEKHGDSCSFWGARKACYTSFCIVFWVFDLEFSTCPPGRGTRILKKMRPKGNDLDHFHGEKNLTLCFGTCEKHLKTFQKPHGFDNRTKNRRY